ncbi:MAG: protein kinase [Vicinamibacteraceae bacterium]
MALPLTPDRWSRIADLYDAAAALPKDQRDRFLADACAGDASLLADVASLVAQDQVASPLDRPVSMADELFVLPPALTIGASLGPYVVEGVLGTGGMGEVYLARDTRLGRRVALKVLPEELADDPDRRARFQREAQVLAALNHPHIAALFGFEDRDGTHAIALELVEGPTLAERLARGPMPVSEVIAVGRQIVDALDAAHDLGIVHRDLKPSNIKIKADGTVKVLDFGLARFWRDRDETAADGGMHLGADPVVTSAGALLGTAAYMSPEQAEGGAADARSDVWAFGCVLYEMLTARRACAGETVADTLAAVLRAEPNWEALPAETPRPIRQLLERCLRKDRKRRLAAIADARWHFDEASRPLETRRRPSRLPWLLAAASAIVAVALAATMFRRSNASVLPAQVVEFAIEAPDGVAFGGLPGAGSGVAAQLAISPDGRAVAFVGTHDGASRLWVRDLDSLTSRPLAGTEGATFPFWSPDSRVVAFFAGDKLKKVPVAGGGAVELCDVAAGRGGSWSRDGVILFASLRAAGVQRVPSGGGAPVAVTSLKPGEDGHRWPFFLPDGRHFLYTATSGPCCPPAQTSAIKVASLDRDAATQTLLEVESAAGYASGHLFFGRAGTVFAQPFDVDQLALVGEAVPIAEHVGWEGSRYVSASMSTPGTLAYSEGGTPTLQHITWYDRAGSVLGTLGGPTTYDTLALSPDERHVAVSMRSAGLLNLDIYVFDLATGNASRLTSHPGADTSPVWSPDGTRIAFARETDGRFSLHQVRIDGSGEETLTSDDVRRLPTSWSRDGRFIAFSRPGASGASDVWLLPLFGDRQPYPIVQGPARETSGMLSPDGHWLAFVGDEGGRPDVFLLPFPEGGPRRRVSKESGSHPLWRRDGKELYYLAADPSRGNTLWAVAIDPSGHAGEPTELFRPSAPRFSEGQIYAVSNDGQRILGGGGRLSPSVAGPLRVLMNWPAKARLRRRS